MKLSEQQKQAFLSYARSAIGAIAAVMVTAGWSWEDVAKALVAALIPPVLRWLNANDAAFGRGSDKV